MTHNWNQAETMECECCGKKTDMWAWFSSLEGEERFCVCYKCGGGQEMNQRVSMSYTVQQEEE